MQSPLALRRSLVFGRRQQVTVFHTRREEQTKMTNEEILGVTVLNSWKLVINRFGKTLSELSDEQLQQQVAPGRNSVFARSPSSREADCPLRERSMGPCSRFLSR